MTIEWQKQFVDEINIRCPYCDHQAAPPIYPYCNHTVFVYVEPAGDSPGFDFVTKYFAESYILKLNSPSEAAKKFMSAYLPPFDQQEIQLYDDILGDKLFSSIATIFDHTEKEGQYPTRVVIAFQKI